LSSQQYNDQLGIYVQEKAEQIDRLQSSLAAAVTLEQAQFQVIFNRKRLAGPPAKKRTAVFAANDVFQKTAASGRHIRTKIVTLKDRLDVGQPVQPAHLAENK
jgi:hypothetical protein